MKMKCHVPGPNVKVLGRTIQVLARFGDELCFESLSDSMLLRTLNAAESAYAMVKFNKNFFSYFNYNYYSSDNDKGSKCKISMKSALNTFKSPTHMDKQVENLEIKLDQESCKLIFQLKCKHGIVKTHYVSILDCIAKQATYTKDLVPNRVTSSQRIFSEALGNFQSSDDQVTLEVSSESLLMRNYIDTDIDLHKIIRTQVNIKPSEFQSYIIGEDTAITFMLKEFRALLAFAEALSLPLQLHFEVTGKPAVFIIHNGSTLEANFVLATSKPDSATQLSQTSSRLDKKRKENCHSFNKGSAKTPNLDNEIANCLDEDSHLFNIIPDEAFCPERLLNGSNISQRRIVAQNMEADDIPESPTSRIIIKSVFKRCFESTFDPKNFQRVILAENSDSE